MDRKRMLGHPKNNRAADGSKSSSEHVQNDTSAEMELVVTEGNRQVFHNSRLTTLLFAP
jgi:hypothetical protein